MRPFSWTARSRRKVSIMTAAARRLHGGLRRRCVVILVAPCLCPPAAVQLETGTCMPRVGFQKVLWLPSSRHQPQRHDCKWHVGLDAAACGPGSLTRSAAFLSHCNAHCHPHQPASHPHAQVVEPVPQELFLPSASTLRPQLASRLSRFDASWRPEAEGHHAAGSAVAEARCEVR